MNTYRKTGRIPSILLLVVFIFAASQPVRSHTLHKNTQAVFQSHLENLAISFIPDWHASMFHVKSPLIGTTWNIFSHDIFSKWVKTSDALNIGIHEFSCFFVTPTINAP